jgi:hypothetical protein
MSKTTKTKRKIINRAFASNRPIKASDCREAVIDKEDKCHPSQGFGHEFEFYPFDNYGCCKRCGTEVLT